MTTRWMEVGGVLRSCADSDCKRLANGDIEVLADEAMGW